MSYEKKNFFIFNFQIEGVPDEILNPRECWEDKGAYDKNCNKLYELFKENFVEYADKCPLEVRQAGPYF